MQPRWPPTPRRAEEAGPGRPSSSTAHGARAPAPRTPLLPSLAPWSPRGAPKPRAAAAKHASPWPGRSARPATPPHTAALATARALQFSLPPQAGGPVPTQARLRPPSRAPHRPGIRHAPTPGGSFPFSVHGASQHVRRPRGHAATCLTVCSVLYPRMWPASAPTPRVTCGPHAASIAAPPNAPTRHNASPALAPGRCADQGRLPPPPATPLRQ